MVMMACRGRERVLIISIMSSAGEAGKLQSVLPGVLVFDVGVTARARNKGTREQGNKGKGRAKLHRRSQLP